MRCAQRSCRSRVIRTADARARTACFRAANGAHNRATRPSHGAALARDRAVVDARGSDCRLSAHDSRAANTDAMGRSAWANKKRLQTAGETSRRQRRQGRTSRLGCEGCQERGPRRGRSMHAAHCLCAPGTRKRDRARLCWRWQHIATASAADSTPCVARSPQGLNSVVQQKTRGAFADSGFGFFRASGSDSIDTRTL